MELELIKLTEQEVIEMVVQDPLAKENPQELDLEDIRTISKKLKNVVSGSAFLSNQPKESKVSPMNS